jgi:glycosyltransferase involved in cell wall biosynthesis
MTDDISLSCIKRKDYIIFAGRLDKTKGIDILLRAWTFVKNVKLVICGTGPEEQWCREFIEEYNLHETVKIIGFVENKKVKQMISEALALILPTQWYEGFPVTIVEAYAYGTPVLGSQIGNVGSLVIDGVTGYTFDQCSPESIVETVNKLVDARKHRLDLYKRTYDHYKLHYTPDENYKILSNIYNQVVR